MLYHVPIRCFPYECLSVGSSVSLRSGGRIGIMLQFGIPPESSIAVSHINCTDSTPTRVLFLQVRETQERERGPGYVSKLTWLLQIPSPRLPRESRRLRQGCCAGQGQVSQSPASAPLSRQQAYSECALFWRRDTVRPARETRWRSRPRAAPRRLFRTYDYGTGFGASVDWAVCETAQLDRRVGGGRRRTDLP
jgi:hypothetical protein